MGAPAGVALRDLLAVDLAALVKRGILSQFPLHAVSAGFTHLADHTPGVVDVGVEAQEVQAVAQREDVCLLIQLQPALGQVLPDHHQGLLQPLLALADDVEVVHISAVIPEAQLLFAEVIQLIQI